MDASNGNNRQLHTGFFMTMCNQATRNIDYIGKAKIFSGKKTIRLSDRNEYVRHYYAILHEND